MPKYRRPRIAFICSEETKQKLEQWATQQNRTVSNLVESIILEAFSRENEQAQPLPQSLTNQQEEEEEDLNAEDFLRILLSGRLPTDGELIEVATTLGVKAEKLIELRSKLKDKKKTTNGS